MELLASGRTRSRKRRNSVRPPTSPVTRHRSPATRLSTSKRRNAGSVPIEHRRGVRRLAVAKQHHRLAAPSRRRRRNTATGGQHIHSQLDEARHVWSVPGGRVDRLVLSPVGRQIAVRCVAHDDVYLYDVSAEERGAVLRGHSAPVTSVAYRPDGKQVATGTERRDRPPLGPGDGPRTGVAQGRRTAPHAVVQPRRQPDCVARRRRQEPVVGLHHRQGNRRPGGVAVGPELVVFSPDSKLVAVAAKEHVRVYDTGSGRPIAVLGPRLAARFTTWRTARMARGLHPRPTRAPMPFTFGTARRANKSPCYATIRL